MADVQCKESIRWVVRNGKTLRVSGTKVGRLIGGLVTWGRSMVLNQEVHTKSVLFAVTLSLLLFLLIYYLSTWAAIIVSGLFITPTSSDTDIVAMAGVFVCFFAFMQVLFSQKLLNKEEPYWRALKLQWPGSKTILVWAAITIFIYWLYGEVSTSIINLFDYSEDDFSSVGSSRDFLDAYGNTILPYIIAIFLTPAAEELLTRGFVYGLLDRAETPYLINIFVCSLLYTYLHIHYDIYGLITIFMYGTYLGFVRRKTNSLVCCIACHSTINISALFSYSNGIT